MIDPKRFQKLIDYEFWKHLTTEGSFKDVIDYKDYKKEDLVRDLSNKLTHFQHFFETPDFLYIPKTNGILRRIKVFSISDTIIYYYCLKELQAELSAAIKSVKYVYGGFKFSPDLMLKIGEIEKLKYDPEYEKFAKNSYRQEWNDYQKLASVLSDRLYTFYIHIDIAHFYDDINLDILEKSIRNAVNDKDEIIDLLFYFLRNSDKKDLGYIQSNVGIPQEDIGEMSRLLANFYLHIFDNRITKILKDYFNTLDEEQNFVYTRFADDMWICFRGEKLKAYKIIQYVSNELQKLKLHVNEKKLKILDHAEFNAHWHFDTWESIFNSKNDLKYLNILADTIYNKCIGRWFSPYSYILKTITGKAENAHFFINYEEAKSFMRRLFDNPLLISKIDRKSNSFYIKLFEKHRGLILYIQDYLHSEENIYPVVEYYLLELLSLQQNDLEALDFFISYFFSSNRKDHQWYSRVLCIKYFIENIQILESSINSFKLSKIIKHLSASYNHQNKRERRYAIRFLNRLRDQVGSDALDKQYTSPSDLEFKLFLKSSGYIQL